MIHLSLSVGHLVLKIEMSGTNFTVKIEYLPSVVRTCGKGGTISLAESLS